MRDSQMDETNDNLKSAKPPKAAYWGFISPYIVWISSFLVVSMIACFDPALGNAILPEIYAAKSFICLTLLCAFRPWRYLKPAEAKVSTSWQIICGLIAGVLVFAIWILPETPFFYGGARGFTEFYYNWFVTPLGSFPEYYSPLTFPQIPGTHPSLEYSPEMAGWPLTTVKLFGSAFVIAIAEEYLFRGFLYRWLNNNNFLSVPISKFDKAAFWSVVVVFALEHDRWLMGAVAGIVYGILAIRTGSLRSSIIAHIVTNFLLGLYVIYTKQYGFW